VNRKVFCRLFPFPFCDSAGRRAPGRGRCIFFFFSLSPPFREKTAIRFLFLVLPQIKDTEDHNITAPFSFFSPSFGRRRDSDGSFSSRRGRNVTAFPLPSLLGWKVLEGAVWFYPSPSTAPGSATASFFFLSLFFPFPSCSRRRGRQTIRPPHFPLRLMNTRTIRTTPFPFPFPRRSMCRKKTRRGRLFFEFFDSSRVRPRPPFPFFFFFPLLGRQSDGVFFFSNRGDSPFSPFFLLSDHDPTGRPIPGYPLFSPSPPFSEEIIRKASSLPDTRGAHFVQVPYPPFSE